MAFIAPVLRAYYCDSYIVKHVLDHCTAWQTIYGVGASYTVYLYKIIYTIYTKLLAHRCCANKNYRWIFFKLTIFMIENAKCL